MMDPTLQIILDIIASLVRFLGLLVFGVGVGWLTLDFAKKNLKTWQVQIAIFLGFIGLTVALARFLSPGALGAFGIGAGAAMLIWGIQTSKKEKD